MDLSDQRTQIILVIVLAVLGGVYAWFTYIYGPKKDLVDELEAEISTLNDEIRVAQIKADQADDALAALQAAQARWAEVLRSFPTESREEQVLSTLSAAEAVAEVFVTDFQGGERRRRPLYFEEDYTIRLLGRYHELGRFISEIASAQRRMTVNRMQISHPSVAEESGGGRGGGSTGPPPTENELIINLVVTTYVVREQSGG